LEAVICRSRPWSRTARYRCNINYNAGFLLDKYGSDFLCTHHAGYVDGENLFPDWSVISAAGTKLSIMRHIDQNIQRSVHIDCFVDYILNILFLRYIRRNGLRPPFSAVIAATTAFTDSG
jgi:hypothetical protein